MLLEERMLAYRGHPSGFDYMRLLLALCVLLGHSVDIVYGFSYGMDFWHSWLRAFSAMVLPMFFALSGYLVAGSYFRCKTLISFLGLRVLRILPALAFEILLCAFILGPLFTSLRLVDYFSDGLFRRYFLNLLGDPQFFLPGLFSTNSLPRLVNLQLWTVPWELCGYLLVALMSVIGVFRSRVFLVLFVLALNIAFLRYTQFTTEMLASNGYVLLESCLAGATVFIFSDKLPHDWRLCAISLIAALAAFYLRADYLAPFPIAYVTAYLGMLNPPRNKIALSGDYSYGIYLYGFPVQQAVAYLRLSHGSWWLHMLYVLPLTIGLAAISWWGVEKRSLALRRFLPGIEERVLAVASPAGEAVKGWIARHTPLMKWLAKPAVARAIRWLPPNWP